MTPLRLARCRVSMLFVALLAGAGGARAHWADLAVMEVAVRAEGTRITLTIPGGLVPEGDVNGDGKVSAEEVPARAAEVAKALALKLALQAPGEPPVPFRVVGAGKPVGARVDPRIATDAPGDSHVAINLAFDPAPLERLRLRYELFIADAPQASCLATIHRGGQLTNHVFTPQQREVTVGDPSARGALGKGAAAATTRPLALLFVLVLLLAGGGTAGLVRTAAVWLLAYAGALAAASLQVLALDPRVTTTLAALAVVLAGGLNLGRGEAGGRWQLAAAIGLVHGVDLGLALGSSVPREEMSAVLPAFAAGALLVQLGIALASCLLARLAAGDRARPARLAISTLAAAIALCMVRSSSGN